MNKMQRYVTLKYVIHSYWWALKPKRQYNNDKEFVYFVNKTPIHLGTLITVANCGQLSHLLSAVFNTISNQIICHNRTYTEPITIMPMPPTSIWNKSLTQWSETIPQVVLSYDITIWWAGKFLCSNCLQFCFTSACHYQ
jgi:hypothetical protein